MTVLSTILYILLFILCLSVLIMIHEAGHLITAKMFRVYCFEYSIGFGPKIFSIKRKKGETYFSLRAIPFGGYVSMYGEAETVPEGLEIDPSRSLLSIARWKRAIIMVAGVTMNFILALVVFFVVEIAFPAYQSHYAHVVVSQDTIAYNLGIRDGDFIYAERYSDSSAGTLIFYDDEATIKYEDNTDDTVYFGYSFANLTIKDTSLYSNSIAYKSVVNDTIVSSPDVIKTVDEIVTETLSSDLNIEVSGYVNAIVIDDNNRNVYFLIQDDFHSSSENSILVVKNYTDGEERLKLIQLPIGGEIKVIGNVGEPYVSDDITYQTLNFSEYRFRSIDLSGGDLLTHKEEGKTPTSLSFNAHKVDESSNNGKGVETFAFTDIALTKSGSKYRLPNDIGLSMQLEQIWNNFGEAVKYSFQDWGNAAVVIFKSLGMLLTSAESWKDVSGIIGIGVISTQVLQQNGVGSFLHLWAMISVNLGIVNLLPFPGLDGWQLLVIFVEGVFKKEIPPKVKGIVSIVGIGLLFILMIAIVVKDLITFVF